MKFYIKQNKEMLSKDNVLLSIETKNGAEFNIWITEEEAKKLANVIIKELKNL